MDQVLWVGKGAVGRVTLWEGGAAQALFTDATEAVPAVPPTCPYHPTFLSRSAPVADLAVMEIAEHSVLFFVGDQHKIEMCKGKTSMRSWRSPSPSWALPPRCGRPRCGTSSALPGRGGCLSARRLGHGQSRVHVIARCAPCAFRVFACFVAKLDEIRTNLVRISHK